MTSRDMVVGIDVGGTFTDAVSLSESTGEILVGKVPSTRTREAEGFLAGIGSVCDDVANLSAIVHGTTVGTNALLERKGAVTAVIATEGFADVLEMRRRDRPQTWGLWGEFEPVSPRNLRVGVTERCGADGVVEATVDPAEVTAAAQDLLSKGAQAVAVTFLHSYANPANEAVAAAALRTVWPTDAVSVSSEILPEIREFERTSTTVLNAYLQPVVGTYLEQLENQLAESGFGGDFLIVASNGGVMTVSDARRFPVRTALSGPAAGVVATAAITSEVGYPNVVTGDVGGTSFDVALIADGEAVTAPQSTIDFGMVIRSPMIEISTIGAGGGSIAWVDASDLARIGPTSAGGVPGPACYGMGNPHPTVTDAQVVLGRINPERPIGGRANLDVDAAKTAIDADIGEPLNLDTDRAADAIVRISNSAMAGALRLVSVERGHDPTNFWYVPFGGGGGLNCCELVSDVGLAGALVPRHPGVISALGCVISDMRHDQIQTIGSPTSQLDIDRLRRHVSELTERAHVRLDTAGVQFEGVDQQLSLDMNYQGQSHTLSVPLRMPNGDAAEPTDITIELVNECFEQAYLATYGRLLSGIETSVLTLHVSVIGRRPSVDLGSLGRPTSDGPRVTGERQVFFDGDWVTTQIIDRATLATGDTVRGPAVIEQLDATTVVPPQWSGIVDRLGNIAITHSPTKKETIS